jgi:hypothetical protein
MSAADGPTVREALAEYRRINNLPADESATNSWACRFGPVTVRLPNFKWRRNAILAHDLHHVLTGYPCTLCGEFRMAAWEFGAGRMPHLAARLFCLPLILAGLVWSPRSTLSAFAAGRQSQSLHDATVCESLLAAPLYETKTKFANPAVYSWSLRDGGRFAFLILEAGVIVLAPMALIAASWLAFDVLLLS